MFKGNVVIIINTISMQFRTVIWLEYQAPELYKVVKQATGAEIKFALQQALLSVKMGKTGSVQPVLILFLYTVF